MVYLREWRIFCGMTQEQVAEKFDTSKGAISRLESGDQRYHQDWLERFAWAFDCQVPDLYRPPEMSDPEHLMHRIPAARRGEAISVLRAFGKDPGDDADE